MDLFSAAREAQRKKEAPLATRMRPERFEDFIGQEEIVGPNRLLRRAIEADRLTSMIFYGPPGTGKTTLAYLIAKYTKAHFEKVNAVETGVAELRKLIKAAEERYALHGRRTIVFIDEIHRFNKGQQDALLPAVEDGTIILLGATTENPYYEVNTPLVPLPDFSLAATDRRRDQTGDRPGPAGPGEGIGRPPGGAGTGCFRTSGPGGRG